MRSDFPPRDVQIAHLNVSEGMFPCWWGMGTINFEGISEGYFDSEAGVSEKVLLRDAFNPSITDSFIVLGLASRLNSVTLSIFDVIE